MIENTNDHTISFVDLLLEAEKERSSITPDKLGSYGIDIVDRCTGGIFPDELVVVGADTGMGKSELAYSIAIANAKKGRKVLLFALEGNVNEIAWRFTQKEISSVEKIKTQEYRANKIDVHKDYAKSIMEEVHDQKRGENLYIFKKNHIPTFDFLKEMIEKSSEFYDMFIIDHLHYIQFGSRESEIEQIGQIMRELKTLTDIKKKPVVLMSHLRKRNPKDDPNSFDLYGSSNIAKEATTIVLISRMEIGGNEEWNRQLVVGEQRDTKRYTGTKIIIDKSRVGMPVTTKLALVYDRQEKRYEEKYSCLIEDESQASKEDLYF